MKSSDLLSQILSIALITLILNSSILYVPVVSAASELDGTLSTTPNPTYIPSNYNGQVSSTPKANDGPNSNIGAESNAIDHVYSPPEINGRMTGGGSVFNGSMRVTHGFELNCDASTNPNNLEINWDKGNKFHLENLTTASCTDDPAIKPNPPSAGFDTYEGSGTGIYNGVPGASAHWIFTDAGEPGNKDSATIYIWDAKGKLVLSVSGNLKGGNHQAHGSTSGTLVSIAVTPVNPTIALGQNKQFNANGTYSDGSTKDITASATWSSSNTSVATIDASGLATSKAIGNSQITASSDGITSPAQTMTVTSAKLVSIAVTPINPAIVLGETQQFTATGTYTDGSTEYLTSTATWTSSNHSAATIAASGFATSIAAGTADITAAAGGITSPAQTLTVTAAKLVSIALTPVNPVIALGQTQQFIANGTYSDGSIKNITSTATWKSDNSSIATISDTGLATSVAAGTTQINATSGGISSPSQTLTVTSAKLVSIAITPENPTITLGQTQQFTANGTYSDGSTKNITTTATWSSSNTSVATIDASGLAASVGAGTTLITATNEGITSPAQTLTVTSDILCNQGGWQYYRDLTINNTGSALTDYQVLVNLTGSAFPTSAQPSGADLRFRDAGGAELSYWFEKWDYANRSALVWVNVSSILASGDTSMRMYYGNPGAVRASDVDATFLRVIDNVKPVMGSWHFDEGSSVTAYDTSGKGNNGALVNDPMWLTGKFGKALSFDGLKDYANAGNDTSLNIQNEISIEAWVNASRGASLENIRAIVDKTGTGNFTDPNSWSFYDTAIQNSKSKGFIGAVFDGRYVYFVPYNNGVYHGQVTRYDTNGSFNDSASWSFYDTAAQNPNSKGFYGAVFDGRYIYFVPEVWDTYTYHGQVTRYDTAGSFTDPNSWNFYDTTAQNSNSIGFIGAVFDGRYIYFVPAPSYTGKGGQVTRYDTTSSFTDSISWSFYDTRAQNPNSRGFYGAVFDGKYIYFVPYGDPGTGHGQVTRYDTGGSFTDPNSWNFYDTKAQNSNSMGFSGAVFDGRYVYFVPIVLDRVTRYDTLGSFADPNSWNFYDTGIRNYGKKGFHGAVFDGKYVFFIPYYDGRVMKYDTTNSFMDSNSWTFYDTGVQNSNSNGGFGGGVFDGRNVYFAPHNGQVTRYDTTGSNASYSLLYGLGQNSYGSTPFGFGMRINTNKGIYSVFDNRIQTKGWHHVTGTYNGTNLVLYVDGIPVSTANASGTIAASDVPLTIGSVLNSYFNGTIDEVRIYNRALNADEVSDLYNNYGYTTLNYPGRVLVRKYTSPEPSISVGAEKGFCDAAPPASITDLTNVSYAPTYINWTWTDPADTDFASLSVWIDGVFRDNIARGVQFFNATGFDPDTEHSIATRTVDTNGNINQTWVNRTTKTAPEITSCTQDGWQYYRDITINNPGSALTDYQVLVNLTGSAFPTSAQTSGADLRFRDAGGAELSYWFETWDYANRSALVWVNVSSILASGDTSMRMYYGNPGAASASDGTKTFEFFDDFSSPILDSSWQVLSGQGSYSLTDNPGYLKYILQGPLSHGGGWTGQGCSGGWCPSLSLVRPFDGDNWILRTKVTYNFNYPGTGAQSQKLIIPLGNGISDYLLIDRGTDQWYNYNDITVYLVNNDTNLVNKNNLVAPDDIVNNGWVRHTYWYEVTRNGQQIALRYSYDGTNYLDVFSATLTTPVEATQRVVISSTVWATAGSYADWDYIYARKYTSPDLLVGVGAEKVSCDSTPPASITDLTNVSYARNYINWTWTDPADADFASVSVWIDGVFKDNIARGVQFFNATGFAPDTEHIIATRTVDIYGNINQTWVNHTARTAPVTDTTSCPSITNLTNKSYAPTYINWTWTEPGNSDFSKVMIYIDGIFKTNVSKGVRFYNATGFSQDTEHTISARLSDVVDCIEPCSNWTVESGIRLDGGWASNPSIVKLADGKYRMYHSDASSVPPYTYPTNIRSAISSDAMNWTKESGIRVGEGYGGQEGWANEPEVLVLSDGTYRMYYDHEYAFGGWVRGVILSAISSDGLNWTKEQGTRIDYGGTYDTVLAEGPNIVELSDGTYRMYYQGLNSQYGNYRILSAVSTDGFNWTKEEGIRINIGGTYDSFGVSSPRIIKFSDGRFVLSYSGADAQWNSRLLTAVSADGLKWSKECGIRIDNKGLEGGPYSIVSPGEIVRISDDQYRMYFTGDRYPPTFYGNRNAILSAIGTFRNIPQPCGSINQTWVNHTARTAPLLDNSPPASITNLASINGTTWINWTWSNPQDSDFNHTMIYLNGSWKDNISNPYYNATGLAPDTVYEIGTRTVDIAGNINATWVNETARTLNVTSARLVSIEVTPKNPAIALGETQHFTANATYSDGSTKNITSIATWSSSNTSVVTIDNSGTATSVSAGTINITASSEGITSPAQALTVTSAKLVSIAITPVNPTISLGQTKQFMANGTYSDGSIKNITSTATWSSGNTSVAAIDVSGFATSKAAGTTGITASSAGITSPAQVLIVTSAILVSIAITPLNPTIALGQTQQFVANGTYSDGSIRNITSFATWASSNTSVATINAAGLATSVAPGTSLINATSDGITSPAQTLTVTSAKPVSIAVTPVNPIIALGQTRQFIANGTYTDGTEKNITSIAAWSSSNTSVATIDASGLATSVSPGNTLINATSEGITSPAEILTVTPAKLVSIAVTPLNPTISQGQTQQFTANGTYTDSSSKNITSSAIWSSSNTSVATIDVTGLATSVAPGTTQINATSDGIISPARTLTVTSAKLVSITVTPVNPTVAIGQTQQFIANGTYSDGTKKNLISIAVWSSSNTSVASINASGLAASVAPGTTLINATSDGISSPAQTLTVAPPAGPDYIRPAVEVIVIPQANVGEPVTITVKATDNVGVISRSLTVNGVPVALDASWNATYSSPAVGVFTAVGTALDAAGNEGLDKAEFRVLSPGDIILPTVGITSPADDSKFSFPTNITGTASDANLISYRLEYSAKDKNEFITFAGGNSSVTNGVLGKLDPTTMRNGLYDIKLTAEDASGNTAYVIKTYQIDGEMKVGAFTISFNDLTVPMAGIPITVTRTYDSRVKSKGDFGIGWTLDFESIELQENRVPGEGWGLYCKRSLFGTCLEWGVSASSSHTIVVSIPGTRDQEFDVQAVTSYADESGIAQGYFTFAAQSGTFSTLESLDPVTYDYLQDDKLYDADFNEINPNRYKLTTMDGAVYTANQPTGLESIRDTNGNTITIGAGGIIHSGGKSVTFTRDALARITKITDPMGSTIRYEYDYYGDLVSVTDQEGRTTRFTYNSDHGLVDIVDPRGIKPARTEYDNDGRVIAHTDADGNRIEYTHNIGTRQEIVKDRLGSITAYDYDDRGNVLQKTDPLGGVTKYTYDARDNKLSETDPLGYTTNYTYDSKDNLLSQKDPLGNTVAYTYNSRGQMLITTDAMGNVTTNTYDANGNLLSTTDPLGYVTANLYDAAGNLIRMTDPLGGVTSYTYDGAGNMVSQTDTLGNVFAYTYDANGNRLSETSPTGGISQYDYDKSNRLVQTIDPYGNTTATEYDAIGKEAATIDKLGNRMEREYDARGNLARLVNPDGTDESYTYDVENRKITSTDRAGRTTSYTYDKLGKMTKTTYPDGNFTQSEYEAAGRVTQVINERSNPTRYTYDAAGRQISVIDALGDTTTYAYDKNGNKLNETMPSGSITKYGYDKANRLVQTIDHYGNLTTTEYNANGKEVATIDKLGNRLQSEYDAKGNLVKMVYPDGRDERYTYDVESRKNTSIDRAGRTTRYTYDKLGRMIKTIYPDGNITQTEYDAAGRITRVINERGNPTSYTYDSEGRQISVIDALGNTTTYAYDNNGNQIQMTDARGSVFQYQYDFRNRKIKTIYPDSTSTAIAYDASGIKVSETDQAGNAMQFEYDALERLVKVTDALGQVTAYAYDESGNMVSQTDANNHITSFEYDKLGRRTKRTLPLGMSETAAYDAAGNMVSQTDFNGNTTTFTYDANSRLTRKSFPDGSSDIFTYTASGQRKTVTDSRGVTSYEYDARDRLVKQTDPDGRSLSYAYNEAGNRVLLTIPSGTTSYTFDVLNRLSTVTDPDGGVTSYTYDAVGNRDSVTYPNGAVAEYTYDSLNRMTNLLNRKSVGGVISSYSYTLAPAGNRIRVVEDTGRKVDYSYDKTYKLTNESINDPVSGLRMINYSYDAVGNRLIKMDDDASRTYTYDANDRLLTEWDNSFTYDNNGNTLKRINATENVLYRYDFQNRLVKADITDVSGSSVVEYAYNGDNIRVQKIVDGSDTTKYLVDGNQPYAQVLLETDGVDMPIVSYVYGDDLISQNRSGSISYYLYDGHMSARKLADSNGTITDSYMYDAFGLLLQQFGSTANNYLYNGEQYDHNVGFYYLRARYYNQAIGRFISMDSYKGDIFDPVSLHEYLYANAAPADKIDPSGQISLSDVILISPMMDIFDKYMARSSTHLTPYRIVYDPEFFFELDGVQLSPTLYNHVKSLSDYLLINHLVSGNIKFGEGVRSPKKAHLWSTAWSILNNRVPIENLRAHPVDEDGNLWYKPEWKIFDLIDQYVLIRQNAISKYVGNEAAKGNEAAEGYKIGDSHRAPNTYPGVSNHCSGNAMDVTIPWRSGGGTDAKANGLVALFNLKRPVPSEPRHHFELQSFLVI
ncbi:MAG: DUF2341 domain-containing protein [Candidatus Methanoperedens sp.]|nr:DUF2341 domain-containing protein [Candidatus Methanoperedens sp.]MCZ7370041.1 DUF2341 domain-containing protein [Candidatus Methanoperedens sp.]